MPLPNFAAAASLSTSTIVLKLRAREANEVLFRELAGGAWSCQ